MNKEVSPMVELYVVMIQRGLKTIDQVPARYREQVRAILEAQTREQERVIKSLEKRADGMEEFTRNNMNDKNKTHISVWISIGIALFTAIVSFVMNLL